MPRNIRLRIHWADQRSIMASRTRSVGRSRPTMSSTTISRRVWINGNTNGILRPYTGRRGTGYFTHSDLHRTNIFVRQGRLSGIIDWEHAGFKPEYWRYTNSGRIVRIETKSSSLRRRLRRIIRRSWRLQNFIGLLNLCSRSACDV